MNLYLKLWMYDLNRENFKWIYAYVLLVCVRQLNGAVRIAPVVRKTPQAHKAIPHFNLISLFSGCGGMDLGFKLAKGFNLCFANDVDIEACETYRHNLGRHILQSDVRTLTLSQLPSAQVVIGGFPCQDFSLISKRAGVNSERGNLYQSFVKVVQNKNPYVFVAENVKGLLTANQGLALSHIIHAFEKAGQYGYRVTPHLINFADYGVPQLRERVLLIGVRKDCQDTFDLPQATHSKKNYVTAKKALKGVDKVKYNNEASKLHPNTVARLALIPPGGNYKDIPKASPLYVKGMISHVYRRLHPDQPSKTLIAAGGGGTYGYHFEALRALTNRERARLFGFPDEFVFCGKKQQVRRQIGNSVPPQGMKLIAQALYQFLCRHFT